MKKIKVRFAPAPTGFLHLGGARTALFNFLFAKKHEGEFILRIEDTDKERSKKEFEEDIIEGLKWLGISWDKIFHQSERIEIYKKYLKKLFDEGKVYPCFCSKEELEAQRQEKLSRGQVPIYSGKCRKLTKKDWEKFFREGRSFVLRFKTPIKKIKFKDIIRGKVEFDTKLIGDFAISQGFERPLFLIAGVIDDFEMGISHVIRGEDHLSNTPKQILLQEALGFPRPEYAHIPLILGKDRSKLSKRHGAVRIRDYKEMGILPEAMVNYLALLGWSSKDNREFFSMEELIEKFSLKDVHKGGAVFSQRKLEWINQLWMRKLEIEDLAKRAIPFLKKAGLIKDEYDFEKIKSIVRVERERMRKLSDLPELADFFFKEKDYDPKLLFWRGMTKEKLLLSLKKSLDLIKKIPEESFVAMHLKDVFLKEAEKFSEDRGELLWPLRVALSFKKASPPFFEIMEILGKKETEKRVEFAIKKIENL